MSRSEEIAAGLVAIRQRVGRACEAAGRDPSEITIIVVTKTYPAADVRTLAELGVHDVGENRDQEAAPKAAECADLGLGWHFVGQLQTNKAGSVARYATAVHSVDRPRLVRALEKGAATAGRRLDALVQVSLDISVSESTQRAGAPPDEAVALAELVAQAEHLRLAGLMAVAPLDEDPDEAFARLATVAAAVRARFPSAAWISAGMSGDAESAIAHGATHLRIGSAILGERPSQG